MNIFHYYYLRQLIFDMIVEEMVIMLGIVFENLFPNDIESMMMMKKKKMWMVLDQLNDLLKKKMYFADYYSCY